jgi:DNA-binding NarL/FixJ family response regulator
MAEIIAVQSSRRPETKASLGMLSSREFKIYGMLARGMRVSDIAKGLNLSIKTVSTHKTRLQEKLGLKSQTDVALHHQRHLLGHHLDSSAAATSEA